jgi:hypothetical protein
MAELPAGLEASIAALALVVALAALKLALAVVERRRKSRSDRPGPSSVPPGSDPPGP